MGKGYSKEDKITFKKYRVNFDKAIGDSEPYAQFCYVRDQLVRKLQEKREPNVERFSVDYIEKVIKSKDTTEKDKFNALLLLKELLKTKHKGIVLYNEEKLLKTLFNLAQSPLREKVLLKN